MVKNTAWLSENFSLFLGLISVIAAWWGGEVTHFLRFKFNEAI